MAPVAMVFGILLTVLGLVGYFGAEPEKQSVTALIPAFVGVPLLVLGILGLQERLRKHAMHLAAALGLLGFLGAGGRLAMSAMKDDFTWGTAQVSQALMAALCAVFVGLCVKSFRDARRARSQ